MAQIFPNSPTGILPSEVLRVFRFLKSLPDDYLVWHHLAPWQMDAPDFLILDPEHKALLLKVSGAMPQDARPAAQLLLLEDERPPLGQAEEQVIQKFLEQYSSGVQSKSDLGRNISAAVLFPHIPHKQLLESRPIDSHSQIRWLGQEVLTGGGLPLIESCFEGPALDEVNQQHLRASFTPEVVVPPDLTTRQPSRQPLEARITHFLLDYDQEAALKMDLDLPDGSEALAGDFRLNVLNGVAGSGKTLLLLYRLRLLHGLFPNKRFLVLTHNRPLIKDMQARYYRLTKVLPDNIEWHTFNSWCRRYWSPTTNWEKPIGETKRQQLIRSVRDEVLANTSVTAGMLRSEIDWAKDQLEFSRTFYLNASRRGRGFRVSNRAQLWEAIMRYQQRLEKMGKMDWGDVPRYMLRFLDRNQIEISPYDVILVDEAQFFAPLWFEIIRRLLKPKTGHLFLAADPTQGFLRRGESWKSLGLEVRGRSHHLKQSYRTTLEILNFATLFYRSRIPTDVDEDILTPNLFDMPSGALPVIIPLATPQDETSRLANEITALAYQGVPLRDMLVLHADWQGAKNLIFALRKRLGANAAWDPKEQYPGDYVRVTTLNAGTGLEAPIVFLAGIYHLFEQEQSLRLSDEEREELIQENTRKIYMAATRAGQRLVITYVGDVPRELRGFLTKLPEDTQVMKHIDEY